MKFKSYFGDLNKFSIVDMFSINSFWFNIMKFLSAFIFISNLSNAIASLVSGTDIEEKNSGLNS